MEEDIEAIMREIREQQTNKRRMKGSIKKKGGKNKKDNNIKGNSNDSKKSEVQKK